MSSVYHLEILEEVMLLACLGLFRFSVCKMKVFKMEATGLPTAPARETRGIHEHLEYTDYAESRHREHMEHVKHMLGLVRGFVGICF